MEQLAGSGEDVASLVYPEGLYGTSYGVPDVDGDLSEDILLRKYTPAVGGAEGNAV
jgi:hypothetical protein